jgi:hypothetical protein
MNRGWVLYNMQIIENLQDRDVSALYMYLLEEVHSNIHVLVYCLVFCIVSTEFIEVTRSSGHKFTPEI